MTAGNRKHPYRIAHNEYQDNQRRRLERQHNVAILLVLAIVITMAAVGIGMYIR